MKNPKITLTKDGLILIDAPERGPLYNGEDYDKLVQQAIKEGVKFKDCDLTPLVNAYGGLEQGKLYDIPEGYKISYAFHNPCIVEKKCLAADEKGNCAQVNNNICKKEYRVAVLEPLTKQEPEKWTGRVKLNQATEGNVKSGDDNPVPESESIGKDNDAIISINSFVTCPHSGLLCYDPLCGKTTVICNNSHCFSTPAKQLTPDLQNRLEHFLKYVDESTYWKEDNDVPNHVIVRAYIDKFKLQQQ